MPDTAISLQALTKFFPPARAGWRAFLQPFEKPTLPALQDISFELRDSERAFQGFTRPVISDDGEYLGRVWTLREVTEARQIERIKDALVVIVNREDDGLHVRLHSAHCANAVDAGHTG